ncbi:Xrs2p LALA0_S01e15984g [Lachancea lanzarotensis]|uniref:LALA0S01e15984g1_1 n=1 Tax=Lachancea lanzarotensis TaxID=1245769 RepID=A0A0C7N5D7_9SACH|nr:uncharacterized protein LALA0_S01e15984g [Lachancea lanzarotensis]CEP60658.1 LALA0S01e15984g1_1 [Lachancea lanzarotensis]
MWVLRFECKGQDGTQFKCSCCLKQAIRYDIGRSTKSPLHIKNDKSISRSHLQLETDDKNFLNVINTGKLTKINGKHVKVGHTAKFSPTSKTTFELGAEPIVAILTYENALWKIPHDISMAESVKQQLSLYGIDAAVTLSPNTTMQIVKQREGNYGNCLFALVSGIPVLRETIISDFLQQLDNIHTNFDERWRELVENNSLFPKYVPFPSIFQTLNFVVTSRKVFAIFKHIVDAGKGTLWMCDGVANLESFVKYQVRSDNVVILVHLNNVSSSVLSRDESNGLDEIQEAKSLKAGAKKIGLGVFDVNDLVNAVLNRDVTPLLRRISVQENTPDAASPERVDSGSEQRGISVSQDTMNSTLKKRKFNRQRVQPLNSLTFFGGGSSIASQETKATGEQPQLGKTAVSEEQLMVEDAAVQPTPKKPRLDHDVKARELSVMPSESENAIPSKRAHNSTEDEDGQSSAVSKRHTIESPTIPSSPSVTDVAELENRNDNIDDSINKESRMEKLAAPNYSFGSSRGDSAHAVDGITLRNSTRPGSFVRAIQEAKSHEVDRIKEKMADVQGGELTEEALMQLDNLAIVESTDLLRSRNDVSRVTTTDANAPWSGRKNFKKFVKIWPQRSSRSSSGSVNDAIRNKAYMITRDYVPMQQFDPRRVSPPVEDMVLDPRQSNTEEPIASENGIDFGVQVEDDEQVFEFTSQRPSTHAAHTTPEKFQSENQQELFIIDEDDSQQQATENLFSDKDAVGPGFASVPNTHSKPISYPENSRRQRSGGVDSEGDSDDSDDEPKFRFRSRKR